MKKITPLLLLITLFILIGAGCTVEKEMEATLDNSDKMMKDQNTGTDVMIDKKKNNVVKEDTEVMMEDKKGIAFSGTLLAGSSAPLVDFTQADYEKAINSNKLVVLYFYANWCPICKKELASGLYPAFNSLNRDDVVGFRVSYKDSDTDDAEEAVAKEFGVAYQHTKVFLKNGERVLKAPNSWDKDDYIENIDKFAN